MHSITHFDDVFKLDCDASAVGIETMLELCYHKRVDMQFSIMREARKK